MVLAEHGRPRRPVRRGRPGRCAAVALGWLLGTTGALVVDRWLLAAAWREASTSSRLDGLLSALALLVTAAALTWLCAAVGASVAAETGGIGRRLAGPLAAALAPRSMQFAVRVVCGVAVAGPLGTLPAIAAEAAPADCAGTTCRTRLAALPVPDRPDVVAQQSATAVPASLRARPARPVVTVRRGDSLWSIAAAHLPSGADPGDIAAAWPRWYRANRAVLGPDPDLIHPGTELVAPEPPTPPPSASPDH